GQRNAPPTSSRGAFPEAAMARRRRSARGWHPRPVLYAPGTRREVCHLRTICRTRRGARPKRVFIFRAASSIFPPHFFVTKTWRAIFLSRATRSCGDVGRAGRSVGGLVTGWSML